MGTLRILHVPLFRGATQRATRLSTFDEERRQSMDRIPLQFEMVPP